MTRQLAILDKERREVRPLAPKEIAELFRVALSWGGDEDRAGELVKAYLAGMQDAAQRVEP